MKNKWMVNYIIDGVMFLLMMALAGMGLLMKYVLLTGRDATLKYGTPVDLLFLGADRHVWGLVHFIVSLFLLGLLALHIILHWKAVVALFRKLIKSSRTRLAIATAFLAASIVLLAFPIAVTPQLVDREPMRSMAREGSDEPLGGGRRRDEFPTSTPHDRTTDHESPAGQNPLTAESEPRGSGPERRDATAREGTEETPSVADTVVSPIEGEDEHERTLSIQGYMTLRQVAQEHGVPESYLLQKLGITDAGAATERLGVLRRTYDFRMSTIEDHIKEYWKEHPPSGGAGGDEV